jgi:hypothetical protein
MPSGNAVIIYQNEVLYDQASRLISTRQLYALLRFHTVPMLIHNTVFDGPLETLTGPERSNLEGGFPLRCFQRLYLPNVATRQCHWRDNRNTRGLLTKVLSY